MDDAGNDTFSGQAGADTFFFKDGFGTDTITDFEVANSNEKINLAGVTGITSFNDLTLNHLSDNGAGDAVITDGVNTLTLTNVAPGSLTMNEFDFV